MGRCHFEDHIHYGEQGVAGRFFKSLLQSASGSLKKDVSVVGVSPDDVYEIMAVGNTAIHHFMFDSRAGD